MLRRNTQLLLSYEKWYPVSIAGFEDCYEASDYGQVRNAVTKKVLSIRKDRKGYSRARLQNNGKVWDGHRAVIIAKTFPDICGKWFDGAEVDHINGWRTDDRPVNLRVVSHRENVNNPVTLSRFKARHLPQLKKMAEDTKKRIKINGIIFDSQREACKFINVKETYLSAIKYGRLKNHTEFDIQFLD